MDCLFCGKTLKNRNKKFCNNFCQSEYEYNKYIEDWKNNKEDGYRGEYQTSNYIKRYLLEKYDYKCSQCGWSQINPYTKCLPLEIEHKDGNYLNNNEDNLLILCPNCHSLTPTYKGANRGHGRKGRQKYNL